MIVPTSIGPPPGRLRTPWALLLCRPPGRLSAPKKGAGGRLPVKWLVPERGRPPKFWGADCACASGPLRQGLSPLI